MKTIYSLLIIALLLSACNVPPVATPTLPFNLAYTQAAQTLSVELTRIAYSSGNFATATPIFIPPFVQTPLPTNTPLPPPPPSPTPPPPPPIFSTSRCDWAAFVSDVTVPDGTAFSASATFTKTWRLKNIGTCTWTTAYKLVFDHGTSMGGTFVNLPSNVGPGQVVDISVNLTAPSSPGHYRGYWMLQNASGVRFGTGRNANNPIWVDINVASSAGSPTPTATSTSPAATSTYTPTPTATRTPTPTSTGLPSTTTITGHLPHPSTPGQTVVVGVSVSGLGPTPTGTVIITTSAGGTCTITLSGGSGTCNIVFNTVGSKTITATYSGDANYAPSSHSVTHNVVQGPSNVDITMPTTPVVGQAVTVSVTVTGAGATPTGTVSITGADVNCTITLSAGTGSCNVVFNTATTYTITATYNGDINYNSSTDTESHTVSQGSSITTITSDSPDPSSTGQLVTVHVVVSGAGVTPTGTVGISSSGTFGTDWAYDPSCSGTITLVGGTGSCTIIFLTPGSYTISASYSGDLNYIASGDTESHTAY